MTDKIKEEELKACGCGNHGEDHDCGCENGECDCQEDEIMHIALDDGTEVDCHVLGVFGVEDKEYIALLPEEEDNVYLYVYEEDEEGVKLSNIEDDSEFDMVSEVFNTLFTDEDEEDEE